MDRDFSHGDGGRARVNRRVMSERLRRVTRRIAVSVSLSLSLCLSVAVALRRKGREGLKLNRPRMN